MMKKLLCKIVAFVTSVSLASSFMAVSAFADDSELYPADLEWDSEETIRSHMIDEPALCYSLPESVDLTENFPTPGAQGSQQSCVGWAVGYALKSGQENVKRGWTVGTVKHNFSPSFIYNQINDGENKAVKLSKGFDILVNTGVCSLKYFSYSAADYSTQPTDQVKAGAALYKSAYWGTIKGITAIKNHLAGGDGVVIGVVVYPDLVTLDSDNPIYDSTAGTSAGGHAVCLIGYDDSKQAFKFINSWGTNWGLSGYGWISYDLVNDSSVNHHGAGVGYVMSPATDDYILGDVDQNGAIESSDSLLVLQSVVKTVTLSDRQLALADVDGDGDVDSSDSNSILQYTVKTISQMPLYD